MLPKHVIGKIHFCKKRISIKEFTLLFKHQKYHLNYHIIIINIFNMASGLLLVACALLCLGADGWSIFHKQVPGLFFDKVNLWSINGTAHGPLDTTYNFTQNWRQALSQHPDHVFLSLRNFQLAPKKILSYQADIYSSQYSSTILLKIQNKDTSIIFLSFSVIVKTFKTQLIQIHTFALTHADKLDGELPVNFTNIWDNSSRSIHLNWITAKDVQNVNSDTYYFQMLGPHNFFFFYRGEIYKHDVQYTILLLREGQIDLARQTTIYKYQKGLDVPMRYENFHPNTGRFYQDEEFCTYGLRSFDLIFDRNSQRNIQFLFDVLGEDGEGIIIDNMKDYVLEIKCYGENKFGNILNIIGWLVVVLVLCCCGCYLCASKMKLPQKFQSDVEETEMNQSIGTWKDIDRKYDGMRMCAMCKKRDVQVQLHCWHFMHLKCLLEWARLNDFCSACKETISTKRHQYYCQICKSREIEMHFMEIVRRNNDGTLNYGMICDICKQGEQPQP